jgi:glycosyltransferase involved in cell wall biosynthesis
MGVPSRAMPLNTTNPLTLARLFANMNRLLDELQPDIVNCHRGESMILWGLLKKRRGGFRLVRTRGDQRLPRNNVFNRWLHGSVADAVITTNSRMARHFREVMDVPRSRLWQIPGGVDTDVFHFDPEGRRRVREEFGYADGHFVLGLLGRFDEVKGQREAIHALAKLHREHGLTQVRLLLAGFSSGLPRERIEDWIQEAGMDEYVRITGRRGDVTACISAFDLGIAPSLWSETIARAALEIMACGRPLVASRVGVMPDLVSPEALVEPGDADDLARAVARCVTSASDLEALAAEQREVVRQHTHTDFLRQTLAVYHTLSETGS